MVGQNVRTPYGEIDLIARQPALSELGPETLVFVEVKTRASRSLGKPEISVGSRKKAHLLAAVQHYMQNQPQAGLDWRVDVVAVERFEGDQPVITHFENALTDL